MKLRSFAAASFLLFGQFARGDAVHPSPYSALPAHKAVATSVDDASVSGIGVRAQDSDQAASLTALQNCESARTPRSGVCEVTRLNDDPVTTAARYPRARSAGTPPAVSVAFRSARLGRLSRRLDSRHEGIAVSAARAVRSRVRACQPACGRGQYRRRSIRSRCGRSSWTMRCFPAGQSLGTAA